MIFPNLSNFRFEFANKQFQKCGFTNTIRTDDGNTAAHINTEIRFNEQRFLSLKVECNI